MSGLNWGPDADARLAAIREDLAGVSTASACQLLIHLGWRNAHLLGLRPLQPLGRGVRLVGRARTCQYLMRRGPEGGHDPERRRTSAEIVLIEAIEPGDIFCVDALGVTTAGIIGDILTARLGARGAVAAIINGAVRDAPYIKEIGLPVLAATTHPSHSGRDLVAVDYDQPINMAGAQVLPGDIILADDEGALAMPLDLAEYVAEHGPLKERLEEWIRAKITAGGSIHDYYPPTPEKVAEYEHETDGRSGHARP
ncbi:MAG: ribonuclease activity regulator RraA [Chloroflexia bacterium]|nr:ribonuclease activity regulator RraA [Chloroflexia bacterium]